MSPEPTASRLPSLASRKEGRTVRLSPVRTVGVWILVLGLLLAGCNRDRPTPTPTPSPIPTGTPAAVPATPQVDEPTVQVVEPTVPAPPTPVPAPTPTPVAMRGTLVLWHAWAGRDGDALAAILDDFQNRYPEIELQTLFVGYSRLAQSYASAVSSGDGPDVLLGPNWWLEDLVAAQTLAPLEDHVAEAELAGYLPAAVENLRYAGHLYGLPTHVELVALYYNRALLGDRPLPATTEDLIAYAQADPRLGAGLYANLYHLSWGLAAYGATLFDDNGRVILDQGPGAAQFLDWLRRAKDTPGIFVSDDYGMLIDRFKKGEFAFFVDGPWSRAELEQALGADLAVGLLPAGPAGPARPWLSADGAFLNPLLDPGQTVRALTLARHLASAQSGTRLAQIAGRVPAQTDADTGGDPLIAGFLAQAAQALPEPNRPEMAVVYTYAGDMLLKVLAGARTPEEAVLETVTLINEETGR